MENFDEKSIWHTAPVLHSLDKRTSHILAQIELLSYSELVNELAIEIEDDMFLEASQIVFNDACRQYLCELSNANIDIHPNLQLKNRRMRLTDSYIANIKSNDTE